MSEYQPKTAYYTPNRIDRVYKSILEKLSKDRESAERVKDLFEDMVSSNPADDEAKRCLVKVLSLIQETSERATKALDSLAKYKAAQLKAQNLPKRDAEEKFTSFDDLQNELTND
jgi:polyhydroxyalkanoate synthesis regulator phasin